MRMPAPGSIAFVRESGSAQHNTWFGIMALCRYRRNGHWSGHENASQAGTLDPLWLRIFAARNLSPSLRLISVRRTRRQGELRHISYIDHWIKLLKSESARDLQPPRAKSITGGKLSCAPSPDHLQSLRQPPLSMPRIDWKPKSKPRILRGIQPSIARCRKPDAPPR